jgi:hypothetical protein
VFQALCFKLWRDCTAKAFMRRFGFAQSQVLIDIDNVILGVNAVRTAGLPGAQRSAGAGQGVRGTALPHRRKDMNF